jgi:hypothetical protein
VAESGKLHATLTRSNGTQTLIVLCPDGKSFSFPNEHPNFVNAKALAFPDQGEAQKDSEAYRKLFDVEESIRDLFGVITDRVRVAEGIVYFDEKPIHNQVTEQILRFMEEGRDDFTPLAKFMEQLEANPNERSKEHLFQWLEKHNLAIDENGHIIGFKGVYQNYTPTRRGPGIVNGVDLGDNALLEYKPGNLVSIPREKVDESTAHCSIGLHVGTRSFAQSFVTGGRVVEVRFSPADVVSVDQSNREKIRVSRLRVVGDAPPASHFEAALRVGACLACGKGPQDCPVDCPYRRAGGWER